MNEKTEDEQRCMNLLLFEIPLTDKEMEEMTPGCFIVGLGICIILLYILFSK